MTMYNFLSVDQRLLAFEELTVWLCTHEKLSMEVIYKALNFVVHFEGLALDIVLVISAVLVSCWETDNCTTV